MREKEERKICRSIGVGVVNDIFDVMVLWWYIVGYFELVIDDNRREKIWIGS